MAVCSYKYSECLKLLELNSNLFARNSDGRLPRYITNNFFLTKMLYKKEYEYYYKKLYIGESEIKGQATKNNNSINDIKNKVDITVNNCYSYRVNNNNSNSNYKELTQILLSEEDKYTLSEKYKLLMVLSLNDNKDEVESKCREILSKIDFSYNKNHILISDILNIISKYNLTKLLPDLKNLKNKLKVKSFLKNDINYVIKYLDQIKNGKINIITKINICIKINNGENEENNVNNRFQTSINQSKKRQTNKILLKRPGTINEIRGPKKIREEEINCIRSIKEKIANTTSSNRKYNNSNNNKQLYNTGLKKLDEKNIQESVNSEYELDETIKNV